MNDSKFHLRWPALLALVCALCVQAACSSAPPEIKHYRLDLDPARAQSEQGEQGEQRPTLAIEHFTVDAAYDNAQIVYRTSPYQLNYYYYHRWAAAPGLMLTDALRQGYEATGLFRSVTAGFAARSDVVLSGHIGAIEEVDVSEEKWIGRIVLELRLRDARTGDLLWSRVVEEQEPLEERSPSGLAQGVSAAVTRIIESTAADIAQAARQSGAVGMLGR